MEWASAWTGFGTGGTQYQHTTSLLPPTQCTPLHSAARRDCRDNTRSNIRASPRTLLPQRSNPSRLNSGQGVLQQPCPIPTTCYPIMGNMKPKLDQTSISLISPYAYRRTSTPNLGCRYCSIIFHPFSLWRNAFSAIVLCWPLC